ncbi:ABC transporter permease [Rummeliibacillus pycnus]|uniref:ABC transporter permease n=1 Tax=Rummeliibacillus pycnus TaxID=101070 RepID=UPI0037C5EB3E
MKQNVWLYIGEKIIMFVLSIFILSLIVFYMARLAPGDPLVSYYGDRAEKMSTEEKARTMERLGLDQPIYKQYGIWFKNALQGEFGLSYKYKEDVIQVINKRAENTIWLGGVSFLLIFLFALVLGSFCALRENTILDQIICKLGTISSCIPPFWMALLLILIFSVNLGFFPSSGAYDIGKANSFKSRVSHLILPLTVMVVSHVWYYAYMIRNKCLEEIRQDYILLAKAKGLYVHEIMWKYCLKNIMPTYISAMAISVPHILGGTYIIEMVFSYPGLGTLSFESAKYHDYNLLMILCLITGIIVISCNTLGQIINERIDPRIQVSEVSRYGK